MKFMIFFKAKNGFKKRNCPMTVLMLSLQVPSESELSSVTSKLIITPSGLPLLKSKIAPQKNQKNICYPNHKIRLSNLKKTYVPIF